MINSTDLANFLEIEPTAQSKGPAAEVSMVAGSKITIARSGLEHLGIAFSDIKKIKLLFSINPKTKALMIQKSSSLNLGYLLSGKPSRPEVYCSDQCRAILKVMKKYLTGAGTIRFSVVQHEEIETDTGVVPVLLVDINSANANAGVLAEMEDE